jgi:hypothetical protein
MQAMHANGSASIRLALRLALRPGFSPSPLLPFSVALLSRPSPLLIHSHRALGVGRAEVREPDAGLVEVLDQVHLCRRERCVCESGKAAVRGRANSVCVRPWESHTHAIFLKSAKVRLCN